MDDKDRFGDKLRDKEKADEDRYVAEQEKAKLARLREQMSKENVQQGLCPRDGSALVGREDNGVVVDECPTCLGMWVDRGEIDLLLSKRKDEAWMTKWIRSMLERRG
jgi:hypothetical protein